MTKEQLAEKLNGRNYKDELPDELDQIARENGLFVVFAYGDDNCEIGGFGEAEISCYGGADIVFCKDGDCENRGSITEEENTERREKLIQAKKNRNLVVACCGEDEKYMWTYDTDIPYATFDIKEGEEYFCKGIVFSVNDLK